MKTVVGVFDAAADAETARVNLLSNGFPNDDVEVQSHASATGRAGATSEHHAEDESFTDKLARFFKRMFGGDDEHAGHYAEVIRRGGAVVTVSVTDDSRVDVARSTLAASGAVDITKRTEAWREEGYSGFDPAAKPFSEAEIEAERRRYGAQQGGAEGTVLPVVHEELEVGKREVDLGAVRVFSRTESRPVDEQVQLREEHAAIDRHAVERPATEADLRAFDGGTIEIHETAEKPVVSKRAKVVEEVVVGRQETVRTETVADEVRNTVVEVEREPGNDADYRAHYQAELASVGGRYEDYAPAYEYGASLGRDGQYSGRAWTNVEPDARKAWLKRYPDTNWDQLKPAVRRGWESSSTAGTMGE